MATVDDLSVRVSASTADFTSGMGRAEDALSDVRNDAAQTAAAMQILQGRMDEAGDEAQTAGAKAGASSGGFMGLSSSATSATGSFAAFSMITKASLIPSLIALSAVVAPLAAGLAGLGVAAGSIVGVGLVGFLGAAATNGEQLQSTFNTLKQTILTEFAPAFDIFAGVLDRLMQHLTAIIPELVPAQKVVRQIAGQFEQLGRAIINVLPAFTQMAVELTQRFLPPFVRWAEKVLPKVPGMLQSLIPIMLEVGRTLKPLAMTFLDIIPTMTELGMTTLNVVAPALEKIIGSVNGAMEAVNGLDKETAALVTTFTILTPILLKLGFLISSLSAPVLAVAGAVGALALAFRTDFGNIRTHIQNLGRDLQKVLGQNAPTLIQNFQTILKTLLPVVKPIISALANLFSTTLVYGIDVAITTLTALSELLTGDFQGALSTTQAFFKRWVAKIESFFGGLATSIQTKLDGVKTAIQDGFRSALDGAKSVLNGIKGWIKSKWNIAKAIGAAFKGAGEAAANSFKTAFNTVIPDSINVPEVTIGGGNIPGTDKELPSRTVGGQSMNLPQLAEGGIVTDPTMAMVGEGGESEAVIPLSKLEQMMGAGGTQQVKLVIEEKTDIVDARIEQGAEMVVEEQGRTTRRNTGRNPNPR